MINEKVFNGIIVVCTSLLLTGLILNGTISQESLMGNLAGIGFNFSLFLLCAFGLQFFQLGIGRNVQAEIFDEHNIAAGIYQGCLFLAIATIIAKGLL